MDAAETVTAGYTCPRCHRTSFHPQDIANLYCGACHLWAEDLRDELVSELTAIDPTVTRRDCFSVAILTLTQIDDPRARLVHGEVEHSWRRGDRIIHAWCEVPALFTYDDGTEAEGTAVVDFTQVDDRARVLPQEHYYARAKVGDVRKFTLAEAIARAETHGCDGPWP